MSIYYNVSEVLGKPKTREEVMQEIRSNHKVNLAFRDLRREFQEQFVQFCMSGKRVDAVGISPIKI